jgi:hypothetical protein
MNQGLPLVAGATFCESILVEEKGMYSIIRMLDTITVTPASPDTPGRAAPALTGQPLVQAMLFVGLKSGDVRGKRTITLQLRSPSNEIKPIGDPVPVLFDGAESGVVLRVQVNLAVEEYGLYWAEVLSDNDLVVRVPLRLRQGEESRTRSSRPQLTEPRQQ